MMAVPHLLSETVHEVVNESDGKFLVCSTHVSSRVHGSM